MSRLTLPLATEIGMKGAAMRARALSSPVGAEPAPTRSCGSCRACCSALTIEESEEVDQALGLVTPRSPGGQACEHECEQGCAVYARRPMSCRIYACWWRRGWGAEHLARDSRPDRLGVIFDDSLDAEVLEIGVPVCVATEARPGAFAPRGAALEEQPAIIQVIASQRLVFMRYWGDGHPSMAHGPADSLRALKEAERRLGYRR